jgi:DNA-binding GntR family transcriptional regulator
MEESTSVDSGNRYRTMQEIVYETIKERILKGQYQPGQRLITGDLSTEMGVSRMPVREALHRLEAATGLITLTPHKGAVVSESSEDDQRDIFRIRAVLEALATRLACAGISKDELDTMEVLNREIQKLTRRKDEDYFEEVNLKFHSIIWYAAKSRRLMGILKSLYDASRNYRYISLKVPGRLDEIIQEHRDILAALRDGDACSAERIVYTHYQNTLDRLVRADHADTPAINRKPARGGA